MAVEKDYEELLRLFNKHKVSRCYIGMGAYAVAFYAKPRYTKDIDILVEPESANAQKIIDALDEFGFKGLGLWFGCLSATNYSRPYSAVSRSSNCRSKEIRPEPAGQNCSTGI